MSGLDKNRLRNKTVSFRVSPDEAEQLNARITACNMPRGEYFIKSLLHNHIELVAGKYESDILGIELMRLRQEIVARAAEADEAQLLEALGRCERLLMEICGIITTVPKHEVGNER